MIVEDVEGQVLLLNRLGNRCDTSKVYENAKECCRLVVYCANSHISIYEMRGDTGSPSLIKVQDVDASALSVHPACVVSIMLTHLRTETGRQRSGDNSATGDDDKILQKYLILIWIFCSAGISDDSASLIMNVSGKLVLIQRDTVQGDAGYKVEERPLYSAPTVLAGSCEQIWLPSHTDQTKPHLTLALW